MLNFFRSSFVILSFAFKSLTRNEEPFVETTIIRAEESSTQINTSHLHAFSILPKIFNK